MSNVHIHLHVSDLEASRAFYERFFGSSPVKEKPGYVKFLPDCAPINLALSAGEAGAGKHELLLRQPGQVLGPRPRRHRVGDLPPQLRRRRRGRLGGSTCCTPLSKIKLGRAFKQP